MMNLTVERRKGNKSEESVSDEGCISHRQISSESQFSLTILGTLDRSEHFGNRIITVTKTMKLSNL